MQSVHPTGCECFEAAGGPVNPEVRFNGVDTTNSNYGDVTLSKCTRCSTVWLRFFIEYESFSRSGRWYRAPIPPERLSEVTAESAVSILIHWSRVSLAGATTTRQVLRRKVA